MNDRRQVDQKQYRYDEVYVWRKRQVCIIFIELLSLILIDVVVAFITAFMMMIYKILRNIQSFLGK